MKAIGSVVQFIQAQRLSGFPYIYEQGGAITDSFQKILHDMVEELSNCLVYCLLGEISNRWRMLADNFPVYSIFSRLFDLDTGRFFIGPAITYILSLSSADLIILYLILGLICP